MPYKLIVVDHWHIPHDDAADELPQTYDTAEAAIAEAKRQLDQQIEIEPGQTAEEFFEDWRHGGEDVLVACGDLATPPAGFCGHDYVRQRATEAALVSEWRRWAEEELRQEREQQDRD